MKITQIVGTKKLGHVMLDLETMGNKSNSAIISIGAVEFDIETGETGDTFYAGVDLQSCLDMGLIVNGSTLMWWMEQNETARKKVAEGGDHISTVLGIFNDWFKHLGEGVQIWGNGARFDIGIMEDAYVKCALPIPWEFRYERDLRTLVSFAPEIKLKATKEFKGVEHDPIDDCKLQIDYASKIWNKIKIR